MLVYTFHICSRDAKRKTATSRKTQHLPWDRLTGSELRGSWYSVVRVAMACSTGGHMVIGMQRQQATEQGLAALAGSMGHAQG